MSDFVQSICFGILANAQKAATALVQQDSYLYWPYALSTIILALIVDRASFLRKELWWNRSSLQDYKLYFVNFVVISPIYGWLVLSEASVVAALNVFFSAYISKTNTSFFGDSNSWYFRVLFTVCVFLAYDLGRFIGHWMLHNSPALWELHKVHHSATAMTPFTSYRVHPFEPMLISAVCIVTTGFVVWAFHHLVGTSISVYLFLGTHFMLAMLNFVDNLRHSPVWITYGKFLNQWLISPAHHQLHHSMEAHHLGCNLGSTLAIWDRLNGTLVAPDISKENFRIGLPEGEDPQHTGIWSIYFDPLRAAYRCIVPRRPSAA